VASASQVTMHLLAGAAYSGPGIELRSCSEVGRLDLRFPGPRRDVLVA
jgi:hypothetical protein